MSWLLLINSGFVVSMISGPDLVRIITGTICCRSHGAQNCRNLRSPGSNSYWSSFWCHLTWEILKSPIIVTNFCCESRQSRCLSSCTVSLSLQPGGRLISIQLWPSTMSTMANTSLDTGGWKVTDFRATKYFILTCKMMPPPPRADRVEW